MVDRPDDLHTNEAYWQEYECPSCGLDFDVSPIPRPKTLVRCGCGLEWLAGEHEPNTYVIGTDGSMMYLPPEPTP